MREKKPKSPILVFATMIFLLMFIVLPPLFRSLFPEEEIVEEVKVTEKDYLLTCSKVSVAENIRIESNISYVEGLPISNHISYMPYAASSDEDIQNDTSENVLMAAEELAIFRGIEGVLMTDSNGGIEVSIEKDVIDSHSDNFEFANFLLPTGDEQQEYYEGQGYSCEIN